MVGHIFLWGGKRSLYAGGKIAIERDELIRGWAYTPDLRSLTLTERIPKQKLFLTKEVYTVV